MRREAHAHFVNSACSHPWAHLYSSDVFGFFPESVPSRSRDDLESTDEWKGSSDLRGREALVSHTKPKPKLKPTVYKSRGSVLPAQEEDKNRSRSDEKAHEAGRKISHNVNGRRTLSTFGSETTLKSSYLQLRKCRLTLPTKETGRTYHNHRQITSFLLTC